MTSAMKVEFDGTQVWRNSRGRRHREDDLPAVIDTDGTMRWLTDGQLHRKSGPAIIYGKPQKMDKYQYDRSWYLYGSRISRANLFQELAGHSDEKMAMLILQYGPIE